MKKEFSFVELERDGRVGEIRLNNPAVRNAVSPKMLNGFSDALDYVENPKNGFRSLIITGQGEGFCSGAHLGAGEGVNANSIDPGAMLERDYHPLLRRLRQLPIPFLTAVNGAAVGIGMSIALMGDMVFAARSAYFMQAFVRIGLVPDGGSTWLLPRIVGLARARELSLLGDKLSAETALAWGLINRMCEDEALIDETRAVARRLAQGPTRAYLLTRKAYWESFENNYEKQIDLERNLQKEVGKTKDFLEGVTAFMEKRVPRFKGA